MTVNAPLFLLLLLLSAPLCAQAPHKKTRMPLRPVPKTSEEIIRPLQAPATDYTPTLLNRILNKLVIKSETGPILPLPVIDSGKDLGPSIGIMPIWALWDKQKKTVKQVAAPSVSYNENLGYTLAYKHYVFPDDKKLFIFRASDSKRVEREYYIYYYTPELYGTPARLTAEARQWVTGKPSFYGYGANTRKSSKANYALHRTGEELTLDLPLIRHLFFNFTHAFYIQKISDGPVKSVQQLRTAFPADFTAASERDSFHTNRFSLLYDDTDHPFLPKIGTYACASVLYSAKSLGSDFSYRIYTLQMKQYYNYKEEGRFVTALHSLVQFQRGDTLPFYAMAQLGESTGLRMAGDGRFTDRGRLVITVEERMTLSRSPFMRFISEFELAPFLDAGTVFNNAAGLKASNFKYGPGVSFRLVLRPQMVATADLSFGSEGTNAIVKVGYPF